MAFPLLADGPRRHEPRVRGKARPAASLDEVGGAPSPPPLCPEIRLFLSQSLWAAWQASGIHGGALAPRPPFWTVAWPGGQALARFVLDHPNLVGGQVVFDCGAGSGIVAIAAALCGARRVVAIDHDPLAIAALRRNAAVNGVTEGIEPCTSRIEAQALHAAEVVLAADLWYDRLASRPITSALRMAARRGAVVLVGDSPRAFSPRCGRTILMRYRFPVSSGIEPSSHGAAYVARLHGEPAPPDPSTRNGGQDGRTL